MSRVKKFLTALGVAFITALIAWQVASSYANSLPKLYRSAVTLTVSQAASARKDLRGFSQMQQEDIEMRVLSQQILSDEVLECVDESPENRRTLRQNIIVEPVKESRLIKVKVDARVPEQAAVLANQVATGFVEFKQEEWEGLLQEALEQLQREHTTNQQNLTQSSSKLAAMSKDAGETFERQSDIVQMHQGLVDATQGRLDEMKKRHGLGSVVKIVDLAQPPTYHAYPNITMISAFAAAGGALVGFALAVTFFVLRRRP